MSSVVSLLVSEPKLQLLLSVLHSILTSTLLKAMQTSSEFKTRTVQSLPIPKVPAVAKRESSSDTIDAINLNVDDEQGFTMTFVETTEDEDDAAIDEAQE